MFAAPEPLAERESAAPYPVITLLRRVTAAVWLLVLFTLSAVPTPLGAPIIVTCSSAALVSTFGPPTSRPLWPAGASLVLRRTLPSTTKSPASISKAATEVTISLRRTVAETVPPAPVGVTKPRGARIVDPSTLVPIPATKTPRPDGPVVGMVTSLSVRAPPASRSTAAGTPLWGLAASTATSSTEPFVSIPRFDAPDGTTTPIPEIEEGCALITFSSVWLLGLALLSLIDVRDCPNARPPAPTMVTGSGKT